MINEKEKQSLEAQEDQSESSKEVETVEGNDLDQNEFNEEPSQANESDIEGSNEESLDEFTGEEVIAKLRSEAEDHYDKYLRTLAELENYKKRVIKERSELIRYAGESLARDLIEVVDDFERALSHLGADVAQEEIVKGINLIYGRLISVLESHSIKAESFVGKTFDPVKQDALASVPRTDMAPNTVIEELKKAYFFKDRLLRPAQVVVSSALTQNEGNEELDLEQEQDREGQEEDSQQ